MGIYQYIRASMRIGSVVIAVFLAGCSSPHPVYPVATGSHALTEKMWYAGSPLQRFVVWSNYEAVQTFLIGTLLTTGHQVVERARLQQLFDEQKIRLQHTPDAEAD